MDTGISPTSAIQTFLVPTAVFTQPRFPVQGMFLDNAAFMYQQPPHSRPTLKHSECPTSGEESSSSVRAVPKGRRPKSTAIPLSLNTETTSFPDRPMCRACGKYFMSRQQLNQHMLVHTDVRKYKCSYCDRSFKQPSHLHQHHRIHTGEKPYKCPIPGCTRAFPQQSNLNHHLRNHDKPAPPPENTCTLCMRTYASETVLRSHIAKIHLCNPDTLLGGVGKSSPKDRKLYTTDNSADITSPKRMKTSLVAGQTEFTNINNTETSMYDHRVTFPIKYEQSPIPFIMNQNSEMYSQNNVDSKTDIKNSIPNLSSVIQQAVKDTEHFFQGKTSGVDFSLPELRKFGGNSENTDSYIKTEMTDKPRDQFDSSSVAIDNSAKDKMDSKVSEMNGNYQYSFGNDNENVRRDSTDSSNSSHNSDLNGQNYDNSPTDGMSVGGRSNKRKAFQPQRILQNKQSADMTVGTGYQ
ncbi:hypothetical protein ACF0H5_014761 [Mactra antiquata]